MPGYRGPRSRPAARPTGVRVVGVHNHRQGVVGDLKPLVGDLVLLADRRLLGLDLAGSVVDRGLADAELLEAAAGTGLADAHVDVGVRRAELLGHGLGQRADGARAVDADGAGEAAHIGAAAAGAAFVVARAAARGHADGEDAAAGSGKYRLAKNHLMGLP